MHQRDHSHRSALSSAVMAIMAAWLWSLGGVRSASAGSVSFNGTYGGSGTSISYDDDDPIEPDSYWLTHEPVVGVGKFDPSLGDLVRVRLDLTFDYSYSMSFDAQGLKQTAPGSYYFASMKLASLGSQILFEREEEPGPRYVLASDGVYGKILQGSGNVGDGAEVSDGDGGSFSVSLSQTVDFSFVPGASFKKTGPADTSLDTLSAGVFLPSTAEFFTINFFDAWGDAAVTLDAGSLVFTYDYGTAGDADEDGEVGFTDLVTLAQNYNTPDSVTWTQGDFTNDGRVDFADLVRLAQNYNHGTPADVSGLGTDFAADWAMAQSLVPEPTILATVAATCLGTLRRWRA